MERNIWQCCSNITELKYYVKEFVSGIDFLFADESWNSWTNLFDESQPYFYIATLFSDMNIDSDEKFKKWFFINFRSKKRITLLNTLIYIHTLVNKWLINIIVTYITNIFYGNFWEIYIKKEGIY